MGYARDEVLGHTNDELQVFFDPAMVADVAQALQTGSDRSPKIMNLPRHNRIAILISRVGGAFRDYPPRCV